LEEEFGLGIPWSRRQQAFSKRCNLQINLYII